LIDSKTKERVIVQIDEIHGPYILIYNWEDADTLDDVLCEEYDILLISSCSDELHERGSIKFYFGAIADSVLLQKILDEVVLYI